MNNKEIQLRLALLRDYMKSHNLNAFIIPSTDPHLSEYPAAHWESRVWISGFTGSAGTVVVTDKDAGLWTDSRYFLQADEQLEGTTIKLFKEGLPDTPSIAEWVISQLKPGETIGFDGNVFSAKDGSILISEFTRNSLNVETSLDPFAEFWENRPYIPKNTIYILPEKYTGESCSSKIARVREYLKKNKADSILATSLDAVAWLLNIRGNDVKCNPVAVAYVYISQNETVIFIDKDKLTDDVKQYFADNNITIGEYSKFYDFIKSLNETICFDKNKITFNVLKAIEKNPTLDKPSVIDLMKSEKNMIELEGFRNAMLKDGVALTRFFMWLEKTLKNNEPLEEIDIPRKLIEFREQQSLFVGESFDTIAGYEGNGAIVHYHVTKESSKKIYPKGLLLIDSGAQYFDGTTDITRTIAVGELTQQMKEDYTLVLKGHIGIALAIFPEGTRGSQIDILARKALWEKGLNYLHGTGHGIGHFLNVHEGPQNIRLNENPTTLELGMVTSNEPGLYRAGEYGIRIENLIVTKPQFTTEYGDFYSFETLTLFPIDTTPIVKELLTEDEIKWLNDYHKNVYEKLSPLVNKEEATWLKAKTQAI